MRTHSTLASAAAGLAFALAAAGSTASTRGAAAGSPALLVLDQKANELVIVDPMARTVLGRVPTGEGPHEVAASADGRLAFVANYGPREAPGHTLSVIDIAARREVRKADLGALRRPHGLAVVEGKVYFTAEQNRALGRYDPEADRVDWIVGLGQDGTHMVVAAPDAKTLYTANIGSNSVTALRHDDGKLAHIAVGTQPEGLDIAPDGREVWAGHRTDGGIDVIDTATGKVKATIDAGRIAVRLKFTPDGRHVLVPDPEGGEVVVLDAEAHKGVKRIPVGEVPVGVVVAPDGRHAYVSLVAGGKVAVIDLEKLVSDGTIGVGSLSDGMAWAPAPRP